MSNQRLLNLVSICLLSSIPLICNCQDTLLPNQPLHDGEFISSSAGTYEMGFFSPDGSQRRFFGVRYKIISKRTIVWVANRDSPLNTTSGTFQLSQNGILQVLNHTNTTALWSSNSGNAANAVAQLLESGNLVVKDDTGNYLWQSFDHPCDTALPGMKIGKNLATGVDRVYRSWKTNSDPGTGNHSFSMDSNGYPQLFLMENGSVKSSPGPWTGNNYTGGAGTENNPIYTFNFVLNQEEIYYTFDLVNASVFSRLVLSSTGVVNRFSWNYRTQDWNILLYAPQDRCDSFGLCSGNGNCDLGKSPVCSCLDRFKPRDPYNWDNCGLVPWLCP